MLQALVGVDAQLVVAAVFHSGADDAAGLLLCLAVKAEHDLAVARVRVAAAVAVLDHLHAGAQGLVVDARLVGPCAVVVLQPYVAVTNGQRHGGELTQGDVLLLVVGGFGPHLDDVVLGEGAVLQRHGHGIEAVLHRDCGDGAFAVGCGADALHGHVHSHVAVGMGHGHGRLMLGEGAVERECVQGRNAGVAQGRGLRVGKTRAIVQIIKASVFLGIEHQGIMVGGDVYYFRPDGRCRYCCGCQQEGDCFKVHEQL